MSCDRSAKVHAYHDDALAAPERTAVEAHLQGCADCRALLAELRGLSGLIAAAPLAPLSPAAMARLSRSLKSVRDRGVLRIANWLTAAAAAVLVGALLLFPDGGTTPKQTVVATGGSDAAWETLAVMPPLDAEENVPEVIVLATWMANDLSYGAGSAAGNGGAGATGERR